MDQFKVNGKEKFTTQQEKIIDYNNKVEQWNDIHLTKKKDSISDKRVNKILLLQNHHTLDELVGLKVISRRTMYNFKDDFKKLGIKQNGFGYKFVKTISNNYSKYFELIELNSITQD